MQILCYTFGINTQFIRSIGLKDEHSKKRTEYPFSLAAVQQLMQIDCHPHVTFFVGENGTGKSTLLEAIAVAFGLNAEGGSKNMHFSTEASHSNLHEYIKIVRGVHRAKDAYFLRAESYYNVASNIDQLDREPGLGGKIIDYYGGKSLHEYSHGESFFTLFNERFSANGMYILDEPEAALSPQRQMELLVRLDELVAQGSQFIIATHSPILLSYPKATIYELGKNGYTKTPYQATDHYRLYKSFLENPEAMLHRLSIPIDND